MMMETTHSCHSESVVRGKLERKDSLETHNKSHTKLFQEEKIAKSVERDVMVENVSSTTEYGSQTIQEKQQEAKMYQPKEKRALEVLSGLSKKIKEKEYMTSRKSFTEAKYKSCEPRKSLSGNGGSVRREHSGSDSASRRKLGLKENTNKDYEKEAKRVEPEVSSSSLVLAARKHDVPVSQRLSYHPGDVRVSKTHKSAPQDRNKDKSKQKYLKEKDRASRLQKYKRHDSASHHNTMETSISYEDMVEREVRKIRKDMEKINKETSEIKEGSTSQLVNSESRRKDKEGLRKGHEDQDALTPFLPSSRCCTPPPRPPVEKYWSDADETEDESDIEKHNMHINSVNIVLTYLKAHSEEYYRKGREPDSDDEMQPRRKIKGRLPFMAQSDLKWNPCKGKFVKKLHKSFRGGNLQSRYLSNQQHAGPSGQEDESLIRDYDCHSRPQSPLGGLTGNMKRLASLSLKYLLSKSSLIHGEHEGGRPLTPSPDHYRSHSPLDSQETRTTQQRNSYSPLTHEDRRNRHIHSRHEDGESYSPWHKRRSLTRESASPSRYRDKALRERESFSSSRHRYDSRRDRESLSPLEDQCNSPWAKESYSPSRYRNYSVRDRGSYSPSRYRDNSARERVSCSPSRYRHDSVRDRGSYSPSRYKVDSWRESYSPSRYRRDSHRDRESYSPSRGDSWRDRVLHSPSRYRHDSVKDRTSRSPSRHRGDSQRERIQREECSLRRAETPALRNTEFFSSLKRSPSQRSPEHYPLGEQLLEPQFSKRLRQKDQSESLSFRDHSRSPLRVYSRRSDLDLKRQRSRSSDKDVSPRRYKNIKYDGNRSLELSKRSQSQSNVGGLSKRDRLQSVTSNTERREEEEKNISDDYFFNPALEKTNEEYQKSGPYIPQDHIQEGEEDFTKGSSLNSSSVASRNMLAHDRLNDVSYMHPDQIKHESYDPSRRGNFTHKTEPQIITLDDTEIDQPKDYFRVSSTSLSFQQHSCVHDVHDKKLQRSTTELNEPLETQENLPGPSGISRINFTGRRDMDDLPDWLNEDSDINCDLEDLNGPLSEVSSLIADHKAATADKTYSDVESASAVPMEQKITARNDRQGIEKASLSLNTAEMSTLMSLIEIAKEHSATGKNLATNLPSILEKICQSKNDSDLLRGLSGGEKKLSANMSHISEGMQDNTEDTGSKKSSTYSGNNKNYTKSSKCQRDDSVVAPLLNKEKNHLPKDKAFEGNTVKKLSEIKEGCKLQQSKSKLQAGKDLSNNTGKAQQSKSKLQVEKNIEKPSRREETNMQSLKKGKFDGSQQKRDKIKEQTLKKKEVVKEPPHKLNPAGKSQKKREIIGSKKTEIERIFGNMQRVRIYVEDVSQSGTRKLYKGGRATSLISPKTTPPNQVGERDLSLDSLDSKVDSESPEAKKGRDAHPPDRSPQEVHPLHQETIILEHSVNTCLACKHKLVPDEFTSITLGAGTVTMRCRNCHTFTKMKAMPLKDISKVSDTQKSTLLKKSCDKRHGTTTGTSLKINSDFGSKASVMKHGQYEEKTKLEGTLASNTQIMKGEHFSQSSARKSKKIHGVMKLNDSSSDSDEGHLTKDKERRQKKPAKKRRRILNCPSTSESSDS